MLEFESLSTKAKIGEVLILISLILKGIGLIGMMSFGSSFMMNAVMPLPVHGLFLAIAAVTVIGIIFGILSLKAIRKYTTQEFTLSLGVYYHLWT